METNISEFNLISHVIGIAIKLNSHHIHSKKGLNSININKSRADY